MIHDLMRVLVDGIGAMGYPGSLKAAISNCWETMRMKA